MQPVLDTTQDSPVLKYILLCDQCHSLSTRVCVCVSPPLQAEFHFRTLKLRPDLSLNEEHLEVVDDSRTTGVGPFELICGREFALGVWEEAVRGMRPGELARIHCPFKVRSSERASTRRDSGGRSPRE